MARRKKLPSKIKEVQWSQFNILNILNKIITKQATRILSGLTNTVGKNTDKDVLNRWETILLHLERIHLHLFLLTGFDGEEISASNTVPSRKKIIGRALALEVDEDLAALLHIQDQKASGTNGGTATSGSWETRDLTDVLTNEIAGASLTSNQITAPAGTYFIRANVAGFDCTRHQAKLYDTTAAADILIGTSEYSEGPSAGAFNHVTRSFIVGRFTLSVESVLEIRHRVENTRTTTGHGVDAGFSVTNVFADVDIRRIS